MYVCFQPGCLCEPMYRGGRGKREGGRERGREGGREGGRVGRVREEWRGKGLWRRKEKRFRREFLWTVKMITDHSLPFVGISSLGCPLLVNC